VPPLATHAIILQSQDNRGYYNAIDATTGQTINVSPAEINAQVLIGVCGAKTRSTGI